MSKETLKNSTISRTLQDASRFHYMEENYPMDGLIKKVNIILLELYLKYVLVWRIALIYSSLKDKKDQEISTLTQALHILLSNNP
jgi:hypothetical protein